MRIAVTGGTGFVGSHTVAALLHQGHEVRLLVRSPERVAPAFEPLAVPPPTDIVQGDVTDPGAVARLLDGCDAVVHCASVFSLDPRQRDQMERTNVAGTRVVLDAAAERGLDPVVHVSSYGALLPARGPLTPDTPPGEGVGTYTRSKAESERVAREYQERGLPVVTVMPGSVWGPDDPHFGESHQLAANMLRGRMRMLVETRSVPIVDVRDVAAAIAAAVTPGRGPRRYLLVAETMSPAGVMRELRKITGVRRRFITVPPFIAASGGSAFDLGQRVLPWRLPLSGEMLRIGVQDVGQISDPGAAKDLGFAPRPVRETLEDTVRSLLETGRITPRDAGRLAR